VTTPPAPPPAPPTSKWPIFKKGDAHVVGGQYPRPGFPPVQRKVDHDRHRIRTAQFDVGDNDPNDREINYGDPRKVCPY
jgi:hypothetical protein